MTDATITRRQAANEIWKLVEQETKLYKVELRELRNVSSDDLRLHLRHTQRVAYHQHKLDGLTAAAMLFERQV